MDRTQWIRAALAVLAAAVPLGGTVAFGWDVRQVLILYWAENLLLGGWQLVKMAGASPAGSSRGSWLGRLFLMGFFLIHYGGFCAVHGMFINVLGGSGEAPGDLLKVGEAKWAVGPLVFVALLGNVIIHSVSSLPPAGLWSLVAMAVSHGMETWSRFFASGKWRTTEASALMVEPYKHIVVVHVALIAGGFLAVSMNNAIPVLVLIVVGKLLLDLRAVRKTAPAKTGDGHRETADAGA